MVPYSAEMYKQILYQIRILFNFLKINCRFHLEVNFKANIIDILK